eukprot:gnl/TRDRNA2_/TRDRNA2_188902_c0_seq1.p1 gnl/TRDRNA2_/TRDRNA2_188902_c0~~gnl/TRDRNA2_/TRDRNA2_188902_c0_seq1.p1  ORF type:complete len:245 (+),score=51.70 gnl/TRDRNA2_/TRDRNA2_188902_c0_seq1:126-860(+)
MSRSIVAAAAGAAAGAVACAAVMRYLQRRMEEPRAKVVQKAVEARRSLFPRDLNGADAPEEVINAMLEMANWAPTHGRTEPWRFTVLRRSTNAIETFFKLAGEGSKRWLSEGADGKAEQDLNKFTKKLPSKLKEIASVSHVVVICMKRQANPEKIMPEWEEVAATACAVQNMHIVGCAHGVAGYWSSGGCDGPMACTEVRSFLGLEDGDRCLGMFYVGMADDAKWAKMQKDAVRQPIADKVQWH